jgi:hypothetical protein
MQMKKIILTVATIVGFFMVTAAKADDTTVYTQNSGGTGAVLPAEEAACTGKPGECNLHARDNNRDGYFLENNNASDEAQRATFVSTCMSGDCGAKGAKNPGGSATTSGEDK